MSDMQNGAEKYLDLVLAFAQYFVECGPQDIRDPAVLRMNERHASVILGAAKRYEDHAKLLRESYNAIASFDAAGFRRTCDAFFSGRGLLREHAGDEVYQHWFETAFTIASKSSQIIAFNASNTASHRADRAKRPASSDGPDPDGLGKLIVA
jgi:hypothetical protein